MYVGLEYRRVNKIDIKYIYVFVQTHIGYFQINVSFCTPILRKQCLRFLLTFSCALYKIRS